MNKNKELPEELQCIINDLFDSVIGEKDISNLMDNLTQDALRGIDQIGSEDAGDTYFYLRGMKNFLLSLKPYATQYLTE